MIAHLVVCIALGLIACGALLGTGVFLRQPDPALNEKVTIVLLLGALAAICLRAAWMWLRDVIFRGATVTVDGGGVTISDRRFLDEPIRVPADELLVAAVDEPRFSSRRWRIPVFRGFSWHGIGASDDDAERPVGFLAHADGIAFPVLSAGEGVINCALLFSRPQVLKANRRTGFWGGRSSVNLSFGGLVLKARSPREFADAFATAGLLRRVTTADLYSVPDTQPIDPASGIPLVPAVCDGRTNPHESAALADGGIGNVPEMPPDPAALERDARALIRGFYLKAGLTALALICGGFALMLVWGRFHWLAVAMVLTGLIVAYEVWPRKEPMFSPGVEIDLRENPALAELIGRICDAANVPPPDAVFLDLEFTASARHNLSEHGAGYAITLGLPLFAAGNVSRLAAVIAHEIAHARYDVSRSRVLTNALGAIARTYERFRHIGPARRLIESHADGFQRKLAMVARGSEYLADLHAARFAGPLTTAGALRSIAVEGDASEVFWALHAAPALEAGLVPPLAEGLSFYLRDARYVNGRYACLDEELMHERPSPYDDHPTTAQRLEFIRRQATPRAEMGDERPALSLLADAAGLEAALIARLAGSRASQLRHGGWPEVSAFALPRHWWAMTRPFAEVLEGFRWSQLPELVSDPERFAEELGVAVGLSRQKYVESDPLAPLFPHHFHVWWTVCAAFGATLVRRGFSVRATTPGSPVLLTRADGIELDPLEALAAVFDGSVTAEDWTEGCRKLGIADLPLACVEISSPYATGFAAGGEQWTSVA